MKKKKILDELNILSVYLFSASQEFKEKYIRGANLKANVYSSKEIKKREEKILKLEEIEEISSKMLTLLKEYYKIEERNEKIDIEIDELFNNINKLVVNLSL